MINKQSLILVTGAAGFIGSCMIHWLNHHGYKQIIAVDDFSRMDKYSNLKDKLILHRVEREQLFSWLYEEKPVIAYVIHLGARTDTTEFDYAVHQHLNVEYSQKLWQYCTINGIPFIYASSAATYGDGSKGYNDDHAIINDLTPLNPYGISKNEVDKWILHQEDHPPFWAGLKFFNVYGPNEYHKGRMASVIFHSYNQIIEGGRVRLFKSHKPDFKDGEQLRDFIYVKDVVDVIGWMMEQTIQESTDIYNSTTPKSVIHSGIYNLGTGQARSFYDLVVAVFEALNLQPAIDFIDMPEDIRERYQYFTEANMKKLRKEGYTHSFTSLEEGVSDYVKNYLAKNNFY
jgi:ADP-L-glycero-D-manno-heptose 6-epimerase